MFSRVKRALKFGGSLREFKFAAAFCCVNKMFYVFAERHSAVRWLNQDNKLIADSRNPQYIIPNRQLHPNGSLEVTNIQLDDTGDYICEVAIGSRIISILNSIEVQGMKGNEIRLSA